MAKVTVANIMIKKVITTTPNNGVVEVARLLDKKKIHGIPVINELKEVVGIITETDFYLKNELGFHIPSYIEFIKNSEFAKGKSQKQSQEYKQLINAKVSDVMTPKCFTISPETTVEELIAIFKKKKLYTLPVVNNSKKLVGIVTIADIIKLI
ncbi:MAG: CBS domain-containing protein [Candidatus Falkowbacteria bacterium]